MRVQDILYCLWHRGQMTIHFLISCLFKPVVRAFSSHFFMTTAMSSNVSTSTQSHIELSLDAMMNSKPNSSSVNAFVHSNDINDNEITSHFVPSLSCASSCGSNSVYGSVVESNDEDDEVSSAPPRV